jgi:putative endonuclease
MVRSISPGGPSPPLAARDDYGDLITFGILAKKKRYYVYILTNRHKNVLYVGVTNSLTRRLSEHEDGINKGFTRMYNCCYLIYFEAFRSIVRAIKREKEIKGWRREKKEDLIASMNPSYIFLNDIVKNSSKHQSS